MVLYYNLDFSRCFIINNNGVVIICELLLSHSYDNQYLNYILKIMSDLIKKGIYYLCRIYD